MSAGDLERQVYAANPVAWFEIFGRIEDKEVGSDPDKAPVANWLQVAVGEAVAYCLKAKRPIRLILYKPRQQGCSTITVEIVYAMARSVKMKVLVIGGQASQTDNLWKILKHYGNTDTFDWGNKWTCNETAGKCSNGTLWERETAGDKEAGRSGNYHAVIATEVARWPTDGSKNAADVLNSVLNCVGGGPGTMVVMESTAQGPKGVFPATWGKAVTLEQAKAGKWGNGYIKIFAPWFRFPRCWAELEPGEEHTLVETIRAAGDAKALRVMEEFKLPLERVKWYHQILSAPECDGDEVKRDREYPTKEEDGFKASAPSRFDLKALEALDAYAANRKEDVVFGVLEKPKEDKRYQHVTFRPCDAKNADIAILEKPEAGRRYVIATDNGRGKSYTDGGDTDPNAVVVVRQGYMSGRGAWVPPEPVACLIADTRWDQDVVAELVARLSAYYGHCMVVPESNRGEMLIKELRDRGVMLFERERKNAEVDSHEHTHLYGWETTPETKRYLTENLAKHIREMNKMGAGIRVAFPWVIQELRTFVRHKDGTEGALKIAGCHDDFVIALAIAMACLESATTFWPQSNPAARPEGLPEERGGAAEVW